MDASSDWLFSWLSDLNLAEYYPVFNQRGLLAPNMLAYSVLDRDQLKSIGVTKMGHVNRLFRAIEKLRSNGGGEDDILPPSAEPVVVSVAVDQKREKTMLPLRQTTGELTRYCWSL